MTYVEFKHNSFILADDKLTDAKTDLIHLILHEIEGLERDRITNRNGCSDV